MKEESIENRKQQPQNAPFAKASESQASSLSDREARFCAQLRIAYAAAGKPLSDSTLVEVAKSLASAVNAKAEEIAPMFEEARNRADIPTQRELVRALGDIRREIYGRPTPGNPEPMDERMTLREYMLSTGDFRLHYIARGRIPAEAAE